MFVLPLFVLSLELTGCWKLLKLRVCLELRFSLLAAAMSCADGADSCCEGIKHKELLPPPSTSCCCADGIVQGEKKG